MDQTNYAKELEDESMSDEQWNELAEKAWKAKDFLQNFDTPSERQRQLIQELHHRRGANRTRTLGRDFTFLSEERVKEVFDEAVRCASQRCVTISKLLKGKEDERNKCLQLAKALGLYHDKKINPDNKSEEGKLANTKINIQQIIEETKVRLSLDKEMQNKPQLGEWNDISASMEYLVDPDKRGVGGIGCRVITLTTPKTTTEEGSVSYQFAAPAFLQPLQVILQRLTFVPDAEPQVSEESSTDDDEEPIPQIVARHLKQDPLRTGLALSDYQHMTVKELALWIWWTFLKNIEPELVKWRMKYVNLKADGYQFWPVVEYGGL
ncbi:hypothetical protein FPQ18DRAFT_393596 [Pyronema domesticum]|nr:hypothetical protein FPQ18DRAFT_393596 [Pyronema domesticum]